MTKDLNIDVSGAITQLLQDLKGSLGAGLIGAILFGSHANGHGNENSDIDLAVVVADSNAEQNRRQAFRTLASITARNNNIALSVETYLRLKEYLKLGDPFAWAVCHDGKILTDTEKLLGELQTECHAMKTWKSVK